MTALRYIGNAKKCRSKNQILWTDFHRQYFSPLGVLRFAKFPETCLFISCDGTRIFRVWVGCNDRGTFLKKRLNSLHDKGRAVAFPYHVGGADELVDAT